MHEPFIILEGTARMTVDGRPHDLKAGDAVTLAPGETHELSNLSNKLIVLLVAGWIC